jgi:hypothetical protein
VKEIVVVALEVVADEVTVIVVGDVADALGQERIPMTLDGRR